TWKDDKFSEGNGLLQCWGDAIHYYEWGGNAYWKWPIPQSEKEKNGNLTQNTGW
ncbi:MAG: RagB/SusD family nutrient uptake outer membrane protein, partial [Bacteroidales bacterium]|nr:RagB/SusD family nutrient uptake outer membrane protein [Bacteroidales bacterium]